MYAENPGWLKASQKNLTVALEMWNGDRIVSNRGGGGRVGRPPLLLPVSLVSTMGAAPLGKGCSCPTAAAPRPFLAGSSCQNNDIPRNGAGVTESPGHKCEAETPNVAPWALAASRSINRLCGREGTPGAFQGRDRRAHFPLLKSLRTQKSARHAEAFNNAPTFSFING